MSTIHLGIDKSSWDRIYTGALDIYEFDKSKIVSETQKFILNAQTTFISLYKEILVGEKMFNMSSNGFANYSTVFNESVLQDEKITTSSMNPKILAFVYYTLYIAPNSVGGYSVFFHKEMAKRTLELVENYTVKEEYKYKDTALYSFLKKTGCTASNLIRYFVFLQNKYPSLEK